MSELQSKTGLEIDLNKLSDYQFNVECLIIKKQSIFSTIDPQNQESSEGQILLKKIDELFKIRTDLKNLICKVLTYTNKP